MDQGSFQKEQSRNSGDNRTMEVLHLENSGNWMLWMLLVGQKKEQKKKIVDAK
jgi:hypothetical protein